MRAALLAGVDRLHDDAARRGGRFAALAGCAKFAGDCAVYAVDDELVGKERTGAR